MQIEIRLKKLLTDNGLDDHGIIAQIANETNYHRHTIRKIYHNKQSNPSLEVLSKICNWLLKHKVQGLPGALFGAEATGLWQAAAEVGLVTIYLGEYQQTIKRFNMGWIAQRDAAVVTEIVRCLSTPGFCGDSKTLLDFEYLPFRVDVSAEHVRKKELEQDQAAAIRMYAKMRADLTRSSAVLIGSQRVLRLLETLVADLFGCPPFVKQSRDVRVPFYLAYQSKLRAVESCFGGLRNPPGVKGKFVKGTHYLNTAGEWVCVPWIDGIQDSGIVVTMHQPGATGMLLAVSGLSGRASEALGRYLVKNAKPFWSPYAAMGPYKIGVYVCKITYGPKVPGERPEPGEAKRVDVEPIDDAILTKYLHVRSRQPSAN
jgi:transcriptional regulator with XRE-family HTH domain